MKRCKLGEEKKREGTAETNLEEWINFCKVFFVPEMSVWDKYGENRVIMSKTFTQHVLCTVRERVYPLCRLIVLFSFPA